MLIKKRAGAHPEKNVCVEVQTNNEKIISYQNKVTYSIYKLPVIYWVFDQRFDITVPSSG